ncbi:docking protein 1 isoform X2 [Calypte anna]|uniref:docking protein 1 isoform X2 n=1 Tax=Calypte anna TaxID=9244 RepID=UPI0011C4153D|nr:docking protein 1 isoform X2 [Calypte anna]
MDTPAKEGSLMVQHSPKFGTKRWKRSWFVLYPASQHGVARLEFFECKEPSLPPERLGTRRLDKTVVRLADCTSVGPVAESGPRPGTAVFRLETSDRSYLFAAEKQQSDEWVAKLCEIAFPVMFSFEAGRRCDSGPGNFTFETKQGNEIFRLVEASIREQKAQVEENRQSCGSLDSDNPSVVLISQALADSLSLELPAEGDDSQASKAGLASRPTVSVEERDAMSLKTRILPELPVPQAKTAVSSTPPRSPLPKVPRAVLPAEDLSSVYSEPLDSVKGLRPWLDPLYSDPVDSKPASGARVPSGASEEAKLRLPLCVGTYEQVRAEGFSQTPAVPGHREHIYDEPEGRAPRSLPPFTCIYDEARPTGEAWRTQGHDGRGGYEYPYNPSTDDYSVPAFHAKAKGPKPVPAPKPQAAFIIPKGGEKSGDPGRQWGNPDSEKVSVKPSLNSSNNNNIEILYSQVVKPQHVQRKEQSVDEYSLSPVYEDLGEI